MPGRIEKTVFISYRRTNLPWALCIYQNLTMHGYDVFFDYLSIDSGDFDKVILENIKARAHFLIVLTPSALERCNQPRDWLRREIETALDERRNIVPLMMESFDFGSTLVKQALTGKLSTLNQYNGLRVPSEYFLEAMDRLRDRYLNVAVGDIELPSLNIEANEITETQKTAANEAAPVEKDQLTAQEWFERGYVLAKNDNFEEAIRCYTESLQLAPDEDTFFFRGYARVETGDIVGAIEDFTEGIELNPEDAEGWFERGLYRDANGDFDRAIQDFDKAIRLKPDHYDAFTSRSEAKMSVGDLDGAMEDANIAIKIRPEEPDAYYDRALIWERKKNHTKAIIDYQKFLKFEGGEKFENEKDVKERVNKLNRILTKKKSMKKKSK